MSTVSIIAVQLNWYEKRISKCIINFVCTSELQNGDLVFGAIQASRKGDWTRIEVWDEVKRCSVVACGELRSIKFVYG